MTLSLTPSGLGLVLDPSPTNNLASACRSAATRTGAALVRGLDLDEPAFQRLVHELGDTVEHKFGEGRADLLKLNASADEGKVVTGRGPLPLHTDGILVGEQTDLIVLYASEFRDEPGSGETTVCDQLAAWAEMPDDLRQTIETVGLEYLVEDRGYFPTVPDDWYEIPTVRDYGRVRSLNLTLPFPAGANHGWQVRVKGGDQTTTDNFFTQLSDFLHRPRFLYQHRWQVGDLLVIDNQRTLHGRTAIGADGVRLLLRGQVTLNTARRDDLHAA
ncbi:TauD/TfdA family dioxygenase [Micromonospora sp. NPDC005553]|uniref:TauD/TfdA family dioxygenase n=1 Tax=Micromonospora sp. NPDC005553 TaxID=3364232 RepID=UPI0036B25E29